MTIVYNQKELNKIIKKANGNWVSLDIKFSHAELWGNSHAVLRENSHAELWENSHAELWGNSHAVLWGNSHAVLWGNSHAVLRENSHAVLRENSHAVLWGNSHAVLRENSHAVLRENSHAVLWENSHAELWGNSHAVLWGNSHAVLRGNSHAVLRENSHAVLWENSHAILRENSHAVLWENSHAGLWDFAVAHVLNKNKVEKGGFALIVYPEYPKTIREWCKMKGIQIKKNRIMLWKITNKNGKDFHSNTVLYDTNSEIICPDWEDHYTQECGFGLHLADSPSGARLFCNDLKNGRLFRVSANINDCKVFDGSPSYPMKLRAKKCRRVKEYPIDYMET